MDAKIPGTDARPSDVWLSLLVPAYEYPEGIVRILDLLAASNKDGVECLVGDDSASDAVEVAVRDHPLHSSGRIHYLRNTPARGAVHNWNLLLSRACGEFVLFMHHDECPELRTFFASLRATTLAQPAPDHVVLNCLLPTRFGRLRSHMPRWARRFLFRFWPSHLLVHNSVGPPSAWVARRCLAPPFRTDLKWLVDVEWYFRMLRASGYARVSMPEISVLSIPQPGISITAGLAGQTADLRTSEARLIEADLGKLPALRLLLPISPVERVVSRLEALAWHIFRAALRLAGEAQRRAWPDWMKAGR